MTPLPTDFWCIDCNKQTKIRPTPVECRHCGRAIVLEGGNWIDPNATGDDSVWRDTCDSHDTRQAEHEPAPTPDDEPLPDPVCGTCGTAYQCGECGYEIDRAGNCQRPEGHTYPNGSSA